MARNMIQIIDDLHDAPAEAVAVALADAVHGLSEASQSSFSFYVNEADEILGRLRANGFDIVATPWRHRENAFHLTVEPGRNALN